MSKKDFRYVTTLPGYGDMLQCPYEQSHLIRAERMQVHLMKCEANHPHMKLRKCPYNYSHHLQEEEYQEHVKTCADRALVDRNEWMTVGKARALDAMRKPEPDAPVKVHPDNLVGENWDDMDEAPYDPEQYCRENRVIRKTSMMTKSQRKKFYEQESIRHAKLAAQEEYGPDEAADAQSSGTTPKRSN